MAKLQKVTIKLADSSKEQLSAANEACQKLRESFTTAKAAVSVVVQDLDRLKKAMEGINLEMETKAD